MNESLVIDRPKYSPLSLPPHHPPNPPRLLIPGKRQQNYPHRAKDNGIDDQGKPVGHKAVISGEKGEEPRAQHENRDGGEAGEEDQFCRVGQG